MLFEEVALDFANSSPILPIYISVACYKSICRCGIIYVMHRSQGSWVVDCLEIDISKSISYRSTSTLRVSAKLTDS